MNRRYLTALLCGFFILYSFSCFTDTACAQTETTQEEELFFVAQKAFDDGFYDVAIRYIEQFLQKFPSTEYYAKARLLYGQCYFFKNQYLNAFDIFQSLQNEKSLQDATLYWLGETYFKGSDYRQAQTYYTKVIDQYPDSEYVPQALYSMGWSFFDQGDYPNALEFFQQVIAEHQDHVLYEDALFRIGESQLNLSHYDEAITSFEEYISNFQQSEYFANALFYLAESYYYENDLLKANTYYAKAAKLSDEPRIAFMSKIGMGWIYLKLKKFSLSERQFSEAHMIAQKHDLSDEEILLGEGALLTETKRYLDALTTYSQFIEKFPESTHLTDALVGKASAAYLLQDYPKAIATYQQILSIQDKHPLSNNAIEKIYYGIAWAYLNQGNIDQAIASFKTIINNTDNDTVKASALSQIGDAYQDAEQFIKALHAYDRILNEFQETLYADYAQFQQGITLLKMGEVDASKMSFKSLKSNFPDSEHLVEVNYYLGFVHFQKQEWTDAIFYVTKFLKNSDKKDFFLAQAQYILALSHFHLKNFKESLNEFRSITSNLKDQPSIQETAEIYIGKCLYELGQTAEAIKHFQNITQQFPLTEAHQDALLWLAAYYLESQDIPTAISYYQKFIDKFPGSNKQNLAHYELGQAYLASEQLDKALSSFEKVTESFEPEIYAKARLAIADIFSFEMSPKEAIQKYNQVAQNVPRFKRDALVKIAKLHEDNDSPPQAIDAYQQALASEQGLSDISNAELFFAIGDNYEMINQPDKAIEEYLKIPYLADNQSGWIVKAHLRVARIFEDQEDWEQAKITYTKILELDAIEVKYAQERLDWINDNLKDH